MSKRQQIRKSLIIFMFFIFPITITWLSPYLPLIYALIGGILSGAVIIFALQFLVSLFLGRIFCGYICSAAGLQECMMRVSEKKIKSPKLSLIKFYIWIPWLITLNVFFFMAGGIKEIDFFAGTTDNWIFLNEPYRFVIYFGVVLMIAVLHLVIGKRAFCHCVCWMAPFMILGVNTSKALRLPRLRLKSKSDSCIDCKQCSIKCPMSLDVMSMAKTKDMDNPECILCGECVDVCPKKVIDYTFEN